MAIATAAIDTRNTSTTPNRDEIFARASILARALIGESVRATYDDYLSNVSGTLNLLQTMQRHGVDHIVFSSRPLYLTHRRPRAHRRRPTQCAYRPLCVSKLMVDRMVADAARAYDLRSVSLRYLTREVQAPTVITGKHTIPKRT